MNIVSISGSPSARSRSAWLVGLARERLAQAAHATVEISVRDLPAAALVAADAGHPQLLAAAAHVARADVLLVATPIYKAAYSGLLKLFLDLLPESALRGKRVLPLATGGSPAHLLAVEYALKPVLAALGARHIVDAVYVTDAQLRPHATLGFVADDAALARLERALQELVPRPVAAAPGIAPVGAPA